MGTKKEYLQIKNKELMAKENIQNFADTDRGSYYNQEEWLKEFLEDKGIFYNNSDSDSGTYNESSSDGDDEQEEVCESFNNSSLKIVSPLLLQELINDFAVCKHCGGKLFV